MARDLVGLLTGIEDTQNPVAIPGSKNFYGQFMANRNRAVQEGLGRLMRGGEPSAQEKRQRALMELSSPTTADGQPKPLEQQVADLTKVVRVHQAQGNTAAATQAAAQIQQLRQLEQRKTQEARAKAQEDRAERGLKIREEQLAMQKTAAGEAKEREDLLLAQQGVSRAAFAQQARDNGNEDLASLIEKNVITLERAASLLFGTSNAVIKAPTADEEQAFDRILNSSSFKDKIEDLKTGMFFKDVNDETKQAIYFKAKELMTRQKMPIEKALEQAITSIKVLDQVPEGSDTDNQGRRKVDRRGRPLPDKTPSPQDDDAYTDLGK